jgi:hypothetical protein
MEAEWTAAAPGPTAPALAAMPPRPCALKTAGMLTKITVRTRTRPMLITCTAITGTASRQLNPILSNIDAEMASWVSARPFYRIFRGFTSARTRPIIASYSSPPLSRFWGMCYNLRAVQPVAKQALTREALQPDHSTLTSDDSSPTAAPYEHASHYCPVCSRRLESRRCKLICVVCGYYMSCADYY